ncbi:50S ribosomal protein L13 [Candidatus Saccharibacteria bacterium]|nr:50S ribosomal protein L13 [Candidatus Saccharibacteria bacterium]
MFKTFNKKAGDVTHKWVIVDVADIPVGRASTFIATRLTGKYDPTFTPHMDSGDYVVVVNADKLVYRGDLESKKYYRHSGFPGSIKEKSAANVPLTEVLERAVKGMLPKNKLQPERMKRLRVFADENHDHTAQQPTPLVIPRAAAESRKETK